jgi:general secretion pathway protein J
MRRRCAPGRSRGFTLVEVLVALLIMAVLATLAWQGLDGILRGRDGSRDAIDRTVRLATVLTQWEQDLQSIYDTAQVPPLSFDGQTLRLTRRTDAGVVLVAWAVRANLWQRWASPPLLRGAELQDQWLRSQQLQGTEPEQLTLAEGASQWQVYYNRGGQWSNAQSTGDLVAAPAVVVPAPAGAASAAPAAAAAASTPDGAASAAPPAPGSTAAPTTPVPAQVLREALPDGVRLVITLGTGTLTRDIALGPTGS